MKLSQCVQFGNGIYLVVAYGRKDREERHYPGHEPEHLNALK
jgi:hypothetical protein